MINFFSYIFERFKAPKTIDFVDMGLGIEARFSRCKAHWLKHLVFSKQFISEEIAKYPHAKSIAILGAGRLFDVPVENLARFDSVTLVDADPLCQAVWKKAFRLKGLKQPEIVIQDASGSICRWTENLNNNLRSTKNAHKQEDLLSIFNALKIDSQSGFRDSADIVVSLNLLSQIPIYWRDRVHKILGKTCKSETDEHGNYEHSLQLALESSYKKLQEDHLRRLQTAAKKCVILITDRYYHYYQQDKAHWQTEKALYLTDIEFKTMSRPLAHDSWLWHIAPQGIEQAEYGIIHEVFAKSFSKPL